MRFGSGKLAVLAVATGAALALTQPGSAAAASGEEAVTQADHALAEALQKHDRKHAAALLDAHFTWIDVTGTKHAKADALKQFPAIGLDTNDADVQTHAYGRLATIRGSHQGARFVRVWAKRGSSWRVYRYLETPVRNAAVATVEAAQGHGDCDNPCRSLPYTPKTAADKAIVATWQKTKVDEWHPDAADWQTHIADEFMIINNTAARNKTERVAIAQKQQAAGVGAPGDPVTKMRIVDFGDAAVMESDHTPYRGGKPYYNIRIWVNRDHQWQLALSQQTSFEAAAPVPAIATK